MKLLLFVALTIFAMPSTVTAQESNLKSDETVQFFRTSAWFDTDSQQWHVPIHAWVYEPASSRVRSKAISTSLKAKYGLSVTDETKENFDSRVNLLLADNERGKQLVIRIGEQVFQLPKTDARGHVRTVLQLSEKAVAQALAGPQEKLLRFETVLQEGDERVFAGELQLISSHGISLISDIDDTVKISQVTDRAKLMENTFYQDFEAVSGMAELYSDLDSKDIPLHFVSSSPWHLYRPLQEFFELNNFPFFTANLKTIRFRDSSILNLFKSGDVTKPKQIEPIMERYPDRQFILIGDSGEQDPTVYEKVFLDYPEKIIAIFIRNVTAGKSSDERFQSIIEQIGPERFLLFTDPEQVRARLEILNIL